MQQSPTLPQNTPRRARLQLHSFMQDTPVPRVRSWFHCRSVGPGPPSQLPSRQHCQPVQAVLLDELRCALRPLQSCSWPPAADPSWPGTRSLFLILLLHVFTTRHDARSAPHMGELATGRSPNGQNYLDSITQLYTFSFLQSCLV